MENPFLCESCRPFGYCRKHHQVASEKVMAEFDEVFYQRVNLINKIKNSLQFNVDGKSTSKLRSLEAIRSLYRISPKQIVMTQQEKEAFLSNILEVSKIEFNREGASMLETCCS